MGVQVDKLWELKHSSLAISYIHCSSDNWGFAEFKKREDRNSKRHMFFFSSSKNILGWKHSFVSFQRKPRSFWKSLSFASFAICQKSLPLPNFSHFKPTRLKMIESKINRQAVVTFSITKASKSLPNDGSLSISSFSPLKTSLKAPLLNTKHFLIFWSQTSYWSSIQRVSSYLKWRKGKINGWSTSNPRFCYWSFTNDILTIIQSRLSTKLQLYFLLRAWVNAIEDVVYDSGQVSL